MPSFPASPESGGFLFSDFALVSQLKAFRDFYSRNSNERSAMKKVLSLVFAGLFVLSAAHANTITENFTNNPLRNGWQNEQRILFSGLRFPLPPAAPEQIYFCRTRTR
jgi:hypothetical protein